MSNKKPVKKRSSKITSASQKESIKKKPASKKPASPASKSGSSGLKRSTPAKPIKTQKTRQTSQSVAASRPGSPPSVPSVSVDASNDAAELLSQLDTSIRQIASDIALSSHYETLSQLDQDVVDLADRVADLRERGYRYKSYLERKVETLGRKWQEAEPSLRRELSNAEAELRPAYDNLIRQYESVARMRGGASSRASALEQQVQALQLRVNTADTALRGIYSGVSATAYQTQQQLTEVAWLLDAVEQASFELLAGENPIQAVKAKWWRDGKNDGPEGVLYLTDQRLLFEQKEKVATKKVLFVTTEAEMVQELLLEVPCGAIGEVKASSKGLMGHEDHLDFEFSDGNVRSAHFHIDGQDSEMWTGLVKRVLNGEIERERWYAEGQDAASIAEAEAEAMSAAPTQCSACGAPLNEKLVRGQRQVECEYCGSVTRW